MEYRLFRACLPKVVNPRLYLARMHRPDASRSASERVRSALNALAEGLLIVDTRGCVVLANQTLADLLGQEQRALTGQALHVLPWQDRHGKPPAAGTHPWEIALSQGAPLRDQLWLADVRGRRHAFRVNCSPILAGNGEYGGVTISLQEVTALDADRIKRCKPEQEIEQADHAIGVSLADAGHQIRSSLNATLGFTELLRRGQIKDEADYRRLLDIVHSSSRHLLELINDILDLSTLESGRLEVKQGECAPYRIVHEVMQALNLKACGEHALIELVCPGAIPASIQTDPARLRQIVSNLVSHVVALSDRGKVEIALRFIPARPQAQLLLEISCERSARAGAGPATGRTKRTATRHLGGTGLGLTLSHQLARAIGAELTVKNLAGAASAFILRLPAGPIETIRLITPEQAASQQGSRSPALGSPWKLSPARVLIVDDAPENRELVRLVLEDAGAATEQAGDGLAAVEQARSRPYDLIIMDLQMPGLDGATATRLLRQYGLKTPIVALTARAMENLEQDIIGAGFTACLVKPIDIDQLLVTVASLVGGTRVCQPLNKLAALPINPQDHKNSPQTPIVSRLAGNARLQSAIEKFLARLDGQLSAIEQAWQARDFGTLASLAHWLKGAGGTVGFDPFNEPAKKLEQLAKASVTEGMEEVLMELKYISAHIARPQVAARVPPPVPDQTRANP